MCRIRDAYETHLLAANAVVLPASIACNESFRSFSSGTTPLANSANDRTPSLFSSAAAMISAIS